MVLFCFRVYFRMNERACVMKQYILILLVFIENFQKQVITLIFLAIGGVLQSGQNNVLDIKVSHHVNNTINLIETLWRKNLIALNFFILLRFLILTPLLFYLSYQDIRQATVVLQGTENKCKKRFKSNRYCRKNNLLSFLIFASLNQNIPY